MCPSKPAGGPPHIAGLYSPVRCVTQSVRCSGEGRVGQRTLESLPWKRPAVIFSSWRKAWSHAHFLRFFSPNLLGEGQYHLHPQEKVKAHCLGKGRRKKSCNPWGRARNHPGLKVLYCCQLEIGYSWGKGQTYTQNMPKTEAGPGPQRALLALPQA